MHYVLYLLSFPFGLSVFQEIQQIIVFHFNLFTLSSTQTPTTCMPSLVESINLFSSYLVAPSLAFFSQLIHCPSSAHVQTISISVEIGFVIRMVTWLSVLHRMPFLKQPSPFIQARNRN